MALHEHNLAADLDQLLASAQTKRASLPSSARPSASVPSRRRVRPEIQRSADSIQPGLRQQMREALHASAWPIFLYGPPGVGKTCAALCLLDVLGGEYLTVGDLSSKLIQAQQGRLETPQGGKIWPEGLWHRIRSYPLLVLDELGCREKVSEAAYDAVKQCIDERHGKPFVAISNIGLAEIAKVYDARVMSRLANGSVIEVGGSDRRIDGQ